MSGGRLENTMNSFLDILRGLLFHPRRELKRWQFKLFHGNRKSHKITCYIEKIPFRIESQSVLAESLFVGHGFEDSEMNLLKRLVKPGMTVLDIGANVGMYSLAFSRRVGRKGMVYAFEPYPPVFRTLTENIRNSPYPNIFPINQACSNVSGVSDFFVFPEGMDVFNSLGASSRNHGKIEALGKMRVKTVTLDDFSLEAGVKKIDLVKIDVEGAEEKVFQGAKRILQENPELGILSEFYEPSARQCGCSLAGLESLLRSYGFKMWYIVDRAGTLDEKENSAFIIPARFFSKWKKL